MNRGGIPLPPVPSHGQFLSYPRQAKRTTETDFLGADEQTEQPYANLATTVLPESLQQKLQLARPKHGPQVAKKVALLTTTEHHEDNLPSPPPLPPPKLPHTFHRSEYQDGFPEPPILLPNHPAQVSKDESSSHASNTETDSRMDYVEVEHQPEMAAEAELKLPYPYEPSKSEPMHNAQEPPPQIRDSSGLDEKQVPVKEALQSKNPTDKEIPAEFVMNLEYECRFIEHKGARLLPRYSKVLGCFYTCSLVCVYHVLLFITGIALAICWGVIYAVVAFMQVWLLMPLQAIHVLCIKGCCQLLLEPMRTCCETISKACRVKEN